MKKIFENKTTYTEEIYMEFLAFHRKKYMLSYILYTVFWGLLLLLCIYLSFGSNNRLQGIILTIGFLAFLSYRIYRPKYIFNSQLKSHKVPDNNTNLFNFFDKYLEVQNNNGSFKFRYFMFHKIFETNNFFYLYVDKENAFLVKKDTFSLGTPENFSKFIRSKCRLKFRKI